MLDRIRTLIESRMSWDRVIAVVEVGSTMHGVTDGSDDLDLVVVYYEPWDKLVWKAPDSRDRHIRTQPDGVRSGPGDIDIAVYTLRKFAGLLLKGNPSILQTLWSPSVHWRTDDWQHVVSLAPAVVAKRTVGAAYLGYMRHQIERYEGKRGQKNVNRPELVERYGYDTKYVYHAVRLALQGAELLSTGRLTLPMKEPGRSLLLDIRRGHVPKNHVPGLLQMAEQKLKQALETSALRERPDAKAVHSMVGILYWDYYSLASSGL